MTQTQTQTHLGLGPSWGLKSLEEGLGDWGLGLSRGPESLEDLEEGLENWGLGPSWGPESLEGGLENLGLGPSWGPESLKEESALAPTWQLKEKIFSCSYEIFMLHHDDVCLI